MKKTLFSLGLACAFLPPALLHAELKMPAIFTDHMVLQQQLANPVWGWDNAGTKVTVTFAGQTKETQCAADGKWVVKLDPVAATAQPQTLTVQGTSKREISDVLVGEVWMCSGQSNMEWPLANDYNNAVEIAAAKRPLLRLISVPKVGTQEQQKDFQGAWELCSPQSAPAFSAVGYFFGRYLQEALQVPVGLIDNAWGGSAAEAWVRRSSLEGDGRFARLMESTTKAEADLQSETAQKRYQEAQAKWKDESEAAKAAGKPQPRAPQSPESWLKGNARPGNIFNGVVAPTLGYGIKGVIWYQGETNAGRAKEYRDLFPFMIEQWRKEQGQGDFPFYWVQLADFMAEQPNPGESAWAELREAQTLTQKLPHTGQAVIIDLGEGRDIHPRNKHDVAARLVRWALVQDYKLAMPYRSPQFKSLAVNGNKALVTLDTFGGKLRTFDVQEARGFAVCGEDKVWHWATGTLVGTDKVEVTAKDVPAPVAVRYAWADNPVCNLYTEDGLPVTPFRTDDFPMVTAPK